MNGQPGGGAFTVKQFCEAHSISVAYYYDLKAAGLGPREMRLKHKVLISWEAAARWRRQREAAADPSLAPGIEADDLAVVAPGGGKID